MGYWLKLYTDILDDPKYFQLSNDAKLGFYELLLVAKKVENGSITGELPIIEDIAFYTRRPVEYWKKVMPELADLGIVEFEDEKPKIRKFKARQEKIPDSERMKQYRKRRNDSVMDSVTTALQQRYDTVTKRNGEKEEDKDKNTDKEIEKKKIKNSSHQSFISDFITAVRVKFINDKQPQRVDDLVDDYGEDIVLEAASWYGQNNPRNMGHALKSIETALRRGWNTKKDKHSNAEKILAIFDDVNEEVTNGT